MRYLLLIAALLTPRPPQLLVLNEPETSLHPDLLPALARLIAEAAAHSQVLVVSHAARLIAALEREEREPVDRAGKAVRRDPYRRRRRPRFAGLEMADALTRTAVHVWSRM